MSGHNGERRPLGKGGAPNDPAKITPSVTRPSALVDVDPDGCAQLLVSAVCYIAATALERGTDPVEALQEVLRLARMLDVVWLSEQFAEEHR